jgi:hypothetical protein
MTRSVAARMADAAQAWSASLDDVQRTQGAWPWPSDAERHRWYYTPTDHGGLALAQMRPGQQRLAMRVLATGLSYAGYVTAATVIGLENVLDHLEGWRADLGRERGRDPQLYWLRVFGEPGEGPWSWRFGGHHVSVHHVVVDGAVAASTPCFLGADPASSPLLGSDPLRPLAGAEDLARDLVRSLDGEQAARALLTRVAPNDIVGANRPRVAEGDLPLRLPDVWRARFTDPVLAEGVEAVARAADAKAGARPEDFEAVKLTAAPKGIAAADLTQDQRERLRALLDVYVGRVPDELAQREAAKYAGERIAAVHFAWAGGFDPGQPHYYRLQGPRLLAEYDNTQRDANHVHSVWRDPEGDFGFDVLRAHVLGAHVLGHHRTGPT